MFEEVRSAVALLEGVARDLDPELVDGYDAAELLEITARGKRVCAAIETLLARRVEATKVWRDGGHRSAAHWVAEATGETVSAASRTLETARALEHLRDTDGAFRSGQLLIRAQLAGEIDSVALWCPSRADEPGFRECSLRAGQVGASP